MFACHPKQLSGYIVGGAYEDGESEKEETIDIFIILTTNLHHIFVKIIFTSTDQTRMAKYLHRCDCSIGRTQDLWKCTMSNRVVETTKQSIKTEYSIQASDSFCKTYFLL